MRFRDRVYTLDEVVQYRCRFMTGIAPNECESTFRHFLWAEGALYPKWRRIVVAPDQLRSFYDDEDEPRALIAEYIQRRRMGGRFPPIILLPGKRMPVDGNHRLRAAKIMGEDRIDAFVPCEE